MNGRVNPPPGGRYDALDCIRAAAMLTGVAYHALLFGGGLDASARGDITPAIRVMDWLHSFRMPLFFLISGFFSRMMLGKYGFGPYLARRWWRIAAPFLIILFAFAALQEALSGPAEPPHEASASAPSSPNPMADQLFGRFARWMNLNHLWFLWYLLVFTTLAPPIAGLAGWLFLRPWDTAADRWGNRALQLNLVPFILGSISIPAMLLIPEARGKWALGGAAAIYNAFPDVLFRYQADWPFYFCYFLAGWWLHRMRHGLPGIADSWLPCLAVGLLAHAVAVALADSYAPRTAHPARPAIGLGSCTAYALGGAYTAFGFLGLFQRYANRPSRVGRYLADTALWVYLIHQALLNRFALRWAGPLGLSPGAQALVATAITLAIALASFELIVRPTPLTRLFGPGPSRRRRLPHEGEAAGRADRAACPGPAG